MLANANNQSHIVQVRKHGQLTIPQRIRESLNIKAGDSIDVVVVKDVIILIPRTINSQGPTEAITDMSGR